jgi:hypothetical protein
MTVIPTQKFLAKIFLYVVLLIHKFLTTTHYDALIHSKTSLSQEKQSMAGS